jgi:hypothetical protein
MLNSQQGLVTQPVPRELSFKWELGNMAADGLSAVVLMCGRIRRSQSNSLRENLPSGANYAIMGRSGL